MDDLADIGAEELGFDDEKNGNLPLVLGECRTASQATTVELTYPARR